MNSSLLTTGVFGLALAATSSGQVISPIRATADVLATMSVSATGASGRSIPPGTDLTNGTVLRADGTTADGRLTVVVTHEASFLYRVDAEATGSTFGSASARGTLRVQLRATRPITGVLRIAWVGTRSGAAGSVDVRNDGSLEMNVSGGVPSPSDRVNVPVVFGGLPVLEIAIAVVAVKSFSTPDARSAFFVTFAPDAAYESVGPGCPGTNGTPMLTALPGERPVPGTVFSTLLTNLPPRQAAFGIIGFLPTPLDLTILGAPGCIVRSDIIAVQSLTNQVGQTTWDLSIPLVPLHGLEFYQQGIVADPTTNALGVIVSHGARGLFGS